MPELPEVETVTQGLKPYLTSQTIEKLEIYHRQLRLPIAKTLTKTLVGKSIETLTRRGKYILIQLNTGWLICHLGMSGNLLLQKPPYTRTKHDHLLFFLSNTMILRYNDPRRFGFIDYTTAHPEQHKYIAHIGVEPLEDSFTDTLLYNLCQKRATTIKNLLMNGRLIAGIGNIYACESLFHSAIAPTRLAKTITKKESKQLTIAIKQVLNNAIIAGGSTLKDFVNSQGKPGYFQQQLTVYGRKQQPCDRCNTLIDHIRINNRSTFYCRNCQK